MTEKLKVLVYSIDGFWKFKEIGDEVDILSRDCESREEALNLAKRYRLAVVNGVDDRVTIEKDPSQPKGGGQYIIVSSSSGLLINEYRFYSRDSAVMWAEKGRFEVMIND